eukprot:EG_transcript_11443
MANVHGVVHRAKLHDKTSVPSHLAVPVVSGNGCRHFVWDPAPSRWLCTAVLAFGTGWAAGALLGRLRSPAVAMAGGAGRFDLRPHLNRPRLAPLYGRRAAGIARTKGRNDRRKTDLYSRFGKKIINAVKAGGPDERANTALRDLIAEAKAANVPLANITNAIAKGSQQETAEFREVVYEAYGKGGAGLMITALTDNVNRAFEKVAATINWSGLTIGKPGSVAFKFRRCAAIFIDTDITEDRLIEVALEAGVDDAELDETDDGDRIVLTEPKDCAALQAALGAAGVACSEARLLFRPLTPEACTAEDEAANRLAIDRLLALDDVDWVDHSMAPTP